MNTRSLSSFALAAVCLAGCATTFEPERTENWTYAGRDEALRNPPPVPRGDLSGATWLAKRQASDAAWWQEREMLIEQAKTACARETGESKTPGYWFGYSGAFRNCMLARGWTPGRSPL